MQGLYFTLRLMALIAAALLALSFVVGYLLIEAGCLLATLKNPFEHTPGKSEPRTPHFRGAM